MSNPIDLFTQSAGLTDEALAAQMAIGRVPSGPLPQTEPLTRPTPVSGSLAAPASLSSGRFNAFFGGVATDLGRLFAASNDNAQRVSALEQLSVDELDKITAQVDLLEERLQASLDLQLGYSAGYTIYSRVNFVDDANIERDPSVIGGVHVANYDPKLQALTLGTYTDRDVLHTLKGSTVADIALDLQLGQPLTAYGAFRTPAHAIDNSEQSYWAETVLTDEPVRMKWPAFGSPYSGSPATGIAAGALAELTITFRQPTSLNTLVIKPFCELPINLAGIFVVKKDPSFIAAGEAKLGAVKAGYSHYYITEFNSQRNGGVLLLNQSTRLFFPLQEECLSLTLVFHQPHYTREVFSVSAQQIVQSSLWQQMLENLPPSSLPTALNLDLASASRALPTLAASIGATSAQSENVQTLAKYQYVYGAYDILVSDRRYVTSSTFVSTPLQAAANLMQGTIVADDELPLSNATVPAASAWIGNAVMPSFWQVPSATVGYDITFGDAEPWYPFAPLNAELVHESITVTTPGVTSSTLRLQARPGTPIYLTSFDGLGHALLIAGVIAGPITGIAPTTVTWPNTILGNPGFYVVSYTPQDTSRWVDFGNITEANGSAVLESVTLRGSDIDNTRGAQLQKIPFVDTNRIAIGFEPNGDASKGEYVPVTVSITNAPIDFPGLVDASGRVSTLETFKQTTAHALDLQQSVFVSQEALVSQDNPDAGTLFTAAHANWDRDPKHAPQLFAIAGGVATPIQNYDANGQSIWDYDVRTGNVRFLNNNSAKSGQIALTYWYYGQTQPCIINRTDYVGRGDAMLTPFDATYYPFIEYAILDDRIYFNTALPAGAVIDVRYSRLFDTVRVRATMTRIDPVNESATPHLYGYTFLARDANGTSDETLEHPEVAWGDLEVFSMGATTQSNPGVSNVAGEVAVSNSLPATVSFHWYRVVNSGSVADKLRFNYDSSNGTTAFWDMNADRYIESDGNSTAGINYQVMNVDGSNTITVNPGESIVVGITNFLLPPNTAGAFHPVTVYSSFTPDYLKSSDWLVTAGTIAKEQSIASVVLN